jgi:hypothetical protein
LRVNRGAPNSHVIPCPTSAAIFPVPDGRRREAEQVGASLRARFLKACAFAGALLLSSLVTPAITLEELKADTHLTPERLIRSFADFKFEPGRTVREPDVFLQRRCGDCDDFATLAADLLRRRGYTTRLVAVFMPKEVHVVCYVAEIKGYLDYNRRQETSPVVNCNSDLSSVAGSVAESFHSQWLTVSEYAFRNGRADFVLTEFR